MKIWCGSYWQTFSTYICILPWWCTVSWKSECQLLSASRKVYLHLIGIVNNNVIYTFYRMFKIISYAYSSLATTCLKLLCDEHNKNLQKKKITFKFCILTNTFNLRPLSGENKLPRTKKFLKKAGNTCILNLILTEWI